MLRQCNGCKHVPDCPALRFASIHDHHQHDVYTLGFKIESLCFAWAIWRDWFQYWPLFHYIVPLLSKIHFQCRGLRPISIPHLVTQGKRSKVISLQQADRSWREESNFYPKHYLGDNTIGQACFKSVSWEESRQLSCLLSMVYTWQAMNPGCF